MKFIFKMDNRLSSPTGRLALYNGRIACQYNFNNPAQICDLPIKLKLLFGDPGRS
jgi:hypothetical protein